MSPLDLIWLFFLFSALQAVLKQYFLEVSRRRLISRIEKERNSRVILLVHREETMSILGFPVLRYIDVNESEVVLRTIQRAGPDIPLDIVLHTPGGLVLASLQIARAIQKHRGKVTALVPHYAMSGGTLIALAADEIVMSEYAVLGPVDPQLGEYSASSVLRAVARKPLAELEDRTLILADQGEKAIAQVQDAVRELLAEKCASERAAELAGLFAGGTWTHDHPITYETVKSLGLPVQSAIPSKFIDLMSMYPQPVRHLPTPQSAPSHHGFHHLGGPLDRM